MKIRLFLAMLPAAALLLTGCGGAELRKEAASVPGGNAQALSEDCPDGSCCASSLTPERLADISVAMAQAEYAAGTDMLDVVITNSGDSDFGFAATHFDLVQLQDGAETVTANTCSRCCCMPDGGTVRAAHSTTWTVYLSDFGVTALEPGDYALRFGTLDAPFTVTA